MPHRLIVCVPDPVHILLVGCRRIAVVQVNGLVTAVGDTRGRDPHPGDQYARAIAEGLDLVVEFGCFIAVREQ